MALKNASCDGIDETSDRARVDRNKRLESTTKIGNFMTRIQTERWSGGSEYPKRVVSSINKEEGARFLAKVMIGRRGPTSDRFLPATGYSVSSKTTVTVALKLKSAAL